MQVRKMLEIFDIAFFFVQSVQKRADIFLVP